MDDQQNIIAKPQNRLRQDINAAKLICGETLKKIDSQIQFAAEVVDLRITIANRDIFKMENLKGLIRPERGTQAQDGNVFLDMLSAVDDKGIVFYRAAKPKIMGDSILWTPVVKNCIEKKSTQVSTEIIPLMIFSVKTRILTCGSR
jgi:hypothetical protein